jgi:hypothetical protein
VKHLKYLIKLVRMYLHLPHILVNIMERLDELEEIRLQPAYRVETIWVPDGCSTEIAWAAMKDGQPLRGSGSKHRVLTDDDLNLLAVLR